MKLSPIVLALMGFLLMPLHAADKTSDQNSLLAKKESYQKKIEDDLNSLSQKIDDIRRRSEKAGSDTRSGVNRQLDSLDKKMQTAQTKLTNVKGQTVDGWEKFRKGLDKAVSDLKKSYQKTASKFH